MSTLTEPHPAHRHDRHDRLEAKKIEVAYITALLEEHRTNRDRLDARTNILITCSGALITVVGVLTALLPRQEQASAALHGTFAVAMALMLAAVLVAQGAAISTSRTIWSRPPQGGSDVERFVGSTLDPLEKLAEQLRMDCEEIARLGGQCRTRHRGLFVAGVLQLLGVIALGVSLGVFLGASPGVG